MLSQLKFAITADARVASAFSKIKGELSQTKGVLAGVEERARRSARAMRNVGLGMTAAVTAPMMLQGRQMLQLYGQQAEAEALVAQAVASTGGAAGHSAAALFRMASGLQEISRYGDESILGSVTAPLLTFTQVAGPEFERAQQAVLDISTVMKTDLRSTAVQVGKSLNDPIKGLGGLSRAGIQFSEDQRNVIEALVETGNIAAAQGMILDELALQFGGQAQKAAEAGLGPLEQLSNAWGDVKEQFGAQIVTFLPEVVEDVKGAVGWFSNLPPEVKKNIVVFGGLATAIGPAAFAIGALGLAFTALSGPVGWAILALGTAAGLGSMIWSEFQKGKQATEDLASATVTGTVAANALTSAMGDEILQSQLLSQALSVDGAMSVEVARRKLGEAQARHENVKAIIAEKRALALGSEAYTGLTGDIRDAQAAVRSLGFPARDIAVPGKSDAFEAAQQHLASLLVERQRLLESDQDMSDQLQRTEDNIRQLEGALATAEGGAIKLGNGLITPIAPAADLSDVLDRLETSAGGRGGSGGGGGAGGALGQLSEAAKLLGNQLEITGKQGGQLGQQAASAFASIRHGADAARDAVARLLDQFADQILQNAFAQFFGPALDGVGAWLFGGANAAGNAFSAGRVVPFASGGVVNGPTMFPMAAGRAGVMGEAGPEAIMPLARVGGKLGVRAVGGEGAPQTSNVFHIDARGADVAAVARLEAWAAQMESGFEGRVHRVNRTAHNRRSDRAWR